MNPDERELLMLVAVAVQASVSMPDEARHRILDFLDRIDPNWRNNVAAQNVPRWTNTIGPFGKVEP